MTTQLMMISTAAPHAISTDVKASEASVRISEENQAGQQNDRKSRWQNAPGIRVSLQSQILAPGIEEYRQLKSDGRRKINTTRNKPDQTLNKIVAPDSFRICDQPRKNVARPGSSSVLESFIRQMGAAGQSQLCGSHIDVTV